MMGNNEILPWTFPEQRKSIIKVIGVGGGGSNAVNHMCRQGIHGVEFVVCNTDIQALRQSPVKNRIQLGKSLTEGRGAGCVPARGRESAIESMDYIKTVLSDQTKMIFITAGMGGGTGTGAAPEIARIAKELGILTVGIVTLPFSFEGRRKIEQAMDGIDELERNVDALLIIQNDKLKEIYGDLKLSDAFAMADNVLSIAAKSIAEIITLKGYVNVDFADVESVMRNSGVALMGAAEAEGEDRALNALEKALVSPLLNSHDIRGASHILVNILHGDKEVTLDETTFITTSLQERVGGEVDLIWGSGRDENLGNNLRVAVIAVGFNRNNMMNSATLGSVAGAPVNSDIVFQMEELPEELQMVTENTTELEEQARLKRQKQEEQRLKKTQKPREQRKKRGVNELPDTDSWIKEKLGKLGELFNEGSERDAEMK
ncbi:cell division protein FtsZ [Porphyromonadaceae bacterium OttesenSCG-928-L07]|nr:cell division protein FtsZ [Porphyromonadaceae bacterium OttesenSCG-928-L07]MDL2251717.1 cell division protein FtsZ [Odoribacter sp. OttesenSCG-928-J03]MDL2330995.1 cell division protein FtsZ [Odoribacter sp. OttesenSCG-928-A06]